MPALILGPLLRHVGPDSATIWVETDQPCTVQVLDAEEHTFTVAGHHFALVVVAGLNPGTVTPYEVRLEGEQVWPQGGTASLIRTLQDGRAVRLAFGSCRYAAPSAVNGSGPSYGSDALDALSGQVARTTPELWPDLLLLLGDQVYADETTPATRRRIAARRGLVRPPGTQVADFEEYTWLYQESWQDPEVRWLLSTIPSAMIFDDHDIHDDWNTSHLWRVGKQATSWWEERIIGGLMSYWVYQHLGNLSPAELEDDEMYTRVRELARQGEDAEPVLREFARAADEEADGHKGARWSHWRDLGRTRVVVLDSRCGRILEQRRSMMDDAELAWVRERMTGDYDHLLIGTSLPWLLAPALQDIEAWDERLSEHPRPRLAALGERLRQAGDLEHWASFDRSFHELAELISAVGRGELGSRAPAVISVLSGDVHHSYVCRAGLDVQSRVYQITCSPLYNNVPPAMRLAFRLAWSRAAERATRTLLRMAARVPRAAWSWQLVAGPIFGNAIAGLTLDGRQATLQIDQPRPSGPGLALKPALELDLTA